MLQYFFLVTVVLGGYWLTVFFIESFYPNAVIVSIMPYHLRSREAVDCVLGYDTDMITVEDSRGFQVICWLHRSGICGGIILAISRHSSLFFYRVSLLLSTLRLG